MNDLSTAPRRILLVNPNTNTGMTRSILASARAVAAPDLIVHAVNPKIGLPSIEGPYDGALAAPQAVELIRKGEAAGYAGAVVACFDDVGLDAARSICTMPIVGICEAAVMLAATLAGRFAIVTTVRTALPVIDALVARYGQASRCLVRAADIRVDDSQAGRPQTLDRIRRAIDETIKSDGAEAIILGSASMTGKAEALAREFGCPVIDPVQAGVSLIDALTRIGARTSKLGAYTAPFSKEATHAAEFTDF